MKLDKSTMLRWPEGLRQAVVNAAAENRRSVHSEILFRLEVSLQKPGLEITHGHLLPCPCGAGVPDLTWMRGSYGPLHEARCPCGNSILDGTADGAALRWNALVRGKAVAA